MHRLGRADLHVHSYWSDGRDAPEELAAMPTTPATSVAASRASRGATHERYAVLWSPAGRTPI
jgi:hypothetical protein